MLTLCISRPDLESKLLAADIATEDSMYVDAVQILNTYSFSGSMDLQKRALVRKAVLYPFAWAGGYQDGLHALDTIRALGDSLLQPLLDWYPVLFSGFRRSGYTTITKLYPQRLVDRAFPAEIEIWPNYPNPFSDVTSFTFKLGEDRHVRLVVHDAMGREVAMVADADYPRGVHSVALISRNLPSGLYFYRFTTEAGVIQRKMILVR